MAITDFLFPNNKQMVDESKPNKIKEIYDSLKTTGRVPGPTADYTTTLPTDSKTLQELEGNLKSGYMLDINLPTPGTYSGAPETDQERKWVTDFYINNRRKPTGDELNAWAANQDKTKWTWAEGSTMRDLGFKNWDEYVKARQTGENFGPWSGSLVPEGGTVLLDDKGKPWIRTYDTQRAESYKLSNGFIPYESKENYPTYSRTPNLPENTPEALLALSNPETVYQARLSDYFDKLVSTDASKIQEAQNQAAAIEQEYLNKKQELNKELQAGTMTQTEIENADAQNKLDAQVKLNDLNTQADNYWTSDKAKAALDDALGQMAQGGDVAILPFYNESQGIIGNATTGLMSSLYQGAWESEQKRIKNIPTYAPPGSLTPPVKPSGDEQREYYTYVDSLGLGGEEKQWLYDNYGSFYGAWRESDMKKSFVDWVKDQLKGGL